MKNLFCTHNQSLALKELGFDIPCFAYVYTGDTGNNVDRYEETEPSRAINFNHDSLCISQPLKSQVFEWFRDNYNLISCIRTNIYGCTIDEQEFYYEIVSVRGVGSYSLYNKFEEAESECIDKLIEMVKNKL
jgi:hypothetical protein